jgi:DNA-directed RNA polymerase delta subunit
MKNSISKTRVSDVSFSRDEKPGFLDLANSLLSDLNARSREIVEKRFGLKLSDGETLEKIGQSHNITRERVRQIIREALKNIFQKTNHDNFLQAEEYIIFTIEKNDGIIKESDIAEKFNSGAGQEVNAIRFFAYCSKKILEVEEKGIFEKAWVVSEEIGARAASLIAEAQGVLEKEKKSLSDDELFKKLDKAGSDLEKSQTLNFLKVATRIKKNAFGKWGMKNWMEVSPKGTREKVYLVLKEKKKPLHFSEIAALIDQFGLGKRKAHPQTVHNELIKDERFVLIGRGIYALKDWGYSDGTIKDVIGKILKKSPRALSKEEVIAEVLKVRRVKKTTIMINLNNRKYFEKKGELYGVKK